MVGFPEEALLRVLQGASLGWGSCLLRDVKLVIFFEVVACLPLFVTSLMISTSE